MASRHYVVEYWIATYHGKTDVFADENSDTEHIIALAKAHLRRCCGPLPFGSESYKVEVADGDD